MTKKTCHLPKPKMISGVRSWEITYDPSTTAGGMGPRQLGINPKKREKEKITLSWTRARRGARS